MNTKELSAELRLAEERVAQGYETLGLAKINRLIAIDKATKQRKAVKKSARKARVRKAANKGLEDDKPKRKRKAPKFAPPKRVNTRLGCFGDGYADELANCGAPWGIEYTAPAPRNIRLHPGAVSSGMTEVIATPEPDCLENLSLTEMSDRMLESAIADFKRPDGSIDWEAYLVANTATSKKGKQYVKFPRLPGDYDVPVLDERGNTMKKDGEQWRGYVEKSEMIPTPVTSAMFCRFYDRVLASQAIRSEDAYGNRYLGAHPRTEEQFSRSSKTSDCFTALPPNDSARWGKMLDSSPLPLTLGQVMPESCNSPTRGAIAPSNAIPAALPPLQGQGARVTLRESEKSIVSAYTAALWKMEPASMTPDSIESYHAAISKLSGSSIVEYGDYVAPAQ